MSSFLHSYNINEQFVFQSSLVLRLENNQYKVAMNLDVSPPKKKRCQRPDWTRLCHFRKMPHAEQMGTLERGIFSSMMASRSSSSITNARTLAKAIELKEQAFAWNTRTEKLGSTSFQSLEEHCFRRQFLAASRPTCDGPNCSFEPDACVENTNDQIDYGDDATRCIYYTHIYCV